MKAHNALNAVKGFALIATISVLLLLTVIAVAFLSLSALTVKTSRFEWAQEEARANARLGLMIAIGELQRDLGPDQRIAVSASIMDANPDTLDIDGVANQHWMGVLSSVFKQNQNGSPFTRDMDGGGLQDARNGTNFPIAPQIYNYIVSGNEGGRDKVSGGRRYLDARTDSLAPGPDTLEIVSRGSVNDPRDLVLVRKVTTQKEQITPDGQREMRPNGAYAFWATSNNVKANVGRPDIHRNELIDHTTGAGMQRMLHPLDTEPFAIAGIVNGQENRDTRVLTPKTFTLISESNRLGVLNNFHAMAGFSSSVICNVRDGGLKKNLSAFLHQRNGDEAPEINDLDPSLPYYIGISGEDRLIGPPNERYAQLRGEEYEESQYHDVAPTFGLLWQWAQLAEQSSFSYASTGIRPQRQTTAMPGAGNSDGPDNGRPFWLRAALGGGLSTNVYDGENLSPADPRNLTDVKITPVIVEACVYYNLATYPVGTGTEQQHALRMCLYPRVGLWNPYNVEMTLDRDMVLQLFLNGKKSVIFNGNQDFSREIYYGGRRVETVQGRPTGLFDDQFSGQVHFLLPSVTIPPGETFIFSMGGPPRPLDPETFAGNRLQAQAPPSSASYLYMDYLQDKLTVKEDIAGARDSDDKDSELMPEAPRNFTERPFSKARNGADNYMFMLKYLQNGATRFAQLESSLPNAIWAREPLLVYGSVSLQAGGGDEFPVAWPPGFSHPVVNLSGPNDHIGEGVSPHPYTRDGFRVRWLQETPDNIGNADSPFLLQSSALGNWNLRASYICRNPFDNVSSNAPYFHGTYTRDMPSDELSWGNIFPVQRNGFQTGFPFGKANFGVDRVVAFELPTREIGIPSLGYLRHLQLSEFVWHPSYSIGSSIADPRVGRTGTVPDMANMRDTSNHGWNPDGFAIGYWGNLFRNIVFELCDDNHLIFDMSYEVNHNLWSDFFLTGATPAQVANFAQDPVARPLNNGNLRLWDRNGDPSADLNDFFRAAGRLMLDGGFDVHSTNKQAWKALLATTRDTQYGSQGRTPFPRTLSPKGEENDQAEYSPRVFTGFRSLGDPEIDSLAEAIVREVKVRAPFFGLSDFINRRLAEDDTGLNGALEAALEASLPNRGQNGRFPIIREDLPSRTTFIAESNRGTPTTSDTTRMDQRLKPASTGYGTPGYITQGDLLQVIGSGLVARSDTFTVRAYGESRDVNGRILAKAWCEAVVQRTPEPINPDATSGLNPRIPQGNEVDFGRRFRIVSFRWLHADEV